MKSSQVFTLSKTLMLPSAFAPIKLHRSSSRATVFIVFRQWSCSKTKLCCGAHNTRVVGTRVLQVLQGLWFVQCLINTATTIDPQRIPVGTETMGDLGTHAHRLLPMVLAAQPDTRYAHYKQECSIQPMEMHPSYDTISENPHNQTSVRSRINPYLTIPKLLPLWSLYGIQQPPWI